MDVWISVKKEKPKVGEQCLCYVVTKRHKNIPLKSIRVLCYLIYKHDRRKRVFSDRPWFQNEGEVAWSVTHWMALPSPPEGR